MQKIIYTYQLLLILAGLWVCIYAYQSNASQLSTKPSREITIAVAANAQFAMEEISKKFEKATGIKIHLVTGASGKLAAQIQHGAPFSLLIAANMMYPQKLYENHFAIHPPNVYAEGQLVVWSLQNLPKIPSSQLLTKTKIQKIAIANPSVAPYGRLAEKYLQKNQLYTTVAPKLVYGESISQVNLYIQSKAAEIGITSQSSVMNPNLESRGYYQVLPDFSLPQGAVILNYGEERNPKISHQFYKFLFSSEARKILKKFGYKVSKKSL